MLELAGIYEGARSHRHAIDAYGTFIADMAVHVHRVGQGRLLLTRNKAGTVWVFLCEWWWRPCEVLPIPLGPGCSLLPFLHIPVGMRR